MMNTYKLELNDKLASLYGLDSYIMTDYDIYGNDFEVLLIDDSARMFDLMIENKLSITFYPFGVLVYETTDEFGNLVDEINADFKDHENPQAAVRFAIALYLVTLAESKS